MIKDILRGARNGDTLQELAERLQSTPDTIEELYKHMLKRLDKHYLSDAAKYFGFMLATASWRNRSTLLHFVCAEYPLWQRVLDNDLTYFESAEFSDICHKLEIRILTRCAGLVEISEHRTYLLPKVVCSPCIRLFPEVREQYGEEFIGRHVREVTFIHRTAMEFLESHFEDFFQEPNWCSKGQLACATSQLGHLSIIPHALPQGYIPARESVGPLICAIMDTIFKVNVFATYEQTDRSFENAADEIINHSFQVISRVHTSFNDPASPWYECYEGEDFGWFEMVRLPFHDCLGFAAFLNCRNYISRYLSSHSPSSEECTYLLRCSLIGYMCYGTIRPTTTLELNLFYAMMEEWLRQEVDANFSTRMQFRGSCVHEVSLWGLILQCMIRFMSDDISDQGSETSLCTSLVEKALSHGADINTSIFRESSIWIHPETENSRLSAIVLEESALSYIEGYRTRRGLHSLKKVGDLLRSRGAIQRHRCRLIQTIVRTGNYRSRTWHQISLDQLDRLFDACDGSFLAESKDNITLTQQDVFLQVIKQIDTSVKPVVDSTFVLRSSFQSGDGEA
jgi:hypothetical protein